MAKIIGERAKITPKVVATPLPPWNFKTGVKICPSIAPIPAKIKKSPRLGAKRVGSKPLAKSNIKTGMAYLKPKIR